MIWKRTIACQMKSAKLEQTTIKIKNDNYIFETKGRIIQFPGFLKAYVEKHKIGQGHFSHPAKTSARVEDRPSS